MDQGINLLLNDIPWATWIVDAESWEFLGCNAAAQRWIQEWGLHVPVQNSVEFFNWLRPQYHLALQQGLRTLHLQLANYPIKLEIRTTLLNGHKIWIFQNKDVLPTNFWDASSYEINPWELIHLLDIPIGVVDRNFRILTGNAKYLQIPKESDWIVGNCCFKAFHGRDTICPHCPGKLTMETLQSQETVHYNRLPGGKIGIYRLRTVPWIHHGEVHGFIEIVTDISGDYVTQKMRDLFFEGMALCLAVLDRQGYFHQVNGYWEKMLGYSSEELLGQSFFQLLAEDLHEIQHQIRSQQELYERTHLWLKKKDGKKVLFDCILNVTEEESPFIFFAGRDITEEELRSIELTEARQQFDQVIKVLPMGIYLYELRGDDLILIGSNPTADRLTGVDSTSLIGMKIEEAFPGLIETEIPRRYRIVAKEGHPWTTSEFFYEDQKIKGVFDIYAFQIAPNKMAVVFMEVTERIRQQLEIQKQEENLRITLDSIGDAVIVTDEHGLITRMNPVACALTKWDSTEAIGTEIEKVFRIFNAETKEEVPNPIRRVIREGKVVGLANHTILKTKDGQEIQIADSGAPIYDSQGNLIGVVLVFRDVTKEYQREEELRHARKMEALGQLTGGIAHDFNNLLAAILGNAEILHYLHGDQLGTARKHVEEIIRVVHSAKELIQSLLIFSRKQPLVKRWITPYQLLYQTQKLVHPVLPPGINLQLKVEETLPPIYIDVALFQTSLINLIVNARDAMPQGGTITLQVEQKFIATTSDALAQCYNIPPGNYLQFSVTDTGTGIPSAIIDRIFDPFFTTKPPGKGTGMGLATVYGTVQEHGGTIKVESTEGKGSTFLIFLPLPTQHNLPISISDTPFHFSTLESLCKGLSILIADDDTKIRETLVTLFQEIGATTFQASNGEETLAKVYSTLLHLIILDIVMPGISGTHVYQTIRRQYPRLPILLISGFNPQEEITFDEEDSYTAFLPKPFRIDQLTEKLSILLSITKQQN